jgi:hypothetical protein
MEMDFLDEEVTMRILKIGVIYFRKILSNTPNVKR